MNLLSALSFTLACSSSLAFQPSASTTTASRRDFVVDSVVTVVPAAVVTASFPQTAVARGRATLEQAFERYTPRIRKGGNFYSNDFKQLVGKNDWAGIQAALQEVPKREKEDLSKADAGVSNRAKQAGQFSDARVLVAADLYAGAFSDNSISPKTKKMKDAVAKLRETVEAMQATARQGLGEASGGMFGVGAKKVPQAELALTMKKLYVQGGNAYNEYVYAANENMPLQFDRLEYIK